MITAEWKESGAPCDSCGQFDYNLTLNISTTNAKATNYRLPPIFTLCGLCRCMLVTNIAGGNIELAREPSPGGLRCSVCLGAPHKGTPAPRESIARD